ncbi:MAG: DMP19 family protein [Prevotella sp.]|jgi:hypothetical protein|nr:DMP19 family protein [Prevotella sp.]MCI2079569.1 DMP19 family protein [Prevotella sp.]MCI2101661.1 DMP19 family protein [Prevotella sp.]HCN54440.1 hypothetical protein [Prevotella sp.]
MVNVKLRDAVVRKAAERGYDEFVHVFVDAIHDAIGGELNAGNMSELNADQITLLAYEILHDEVMDGGFVQLIHNGYGAFIFRNPFDKALRNWGLHDFYKLINKGRKVYSRTHENIEKEFTDEEFMALFEQYPEWDDFDDEFVENEESWTEEIAHYIDDHIDQFAIIEKDE